MREDDFSSEDFYDGLEEFSIEEYGTAEADRGQKMKAGRCLYCMEPMQGPVCRSCGRSPGLMNRDDQLPAGTILWNGKNSYLIGRVLGEGGFGITYLGWDINLERKVAIKEFYPKWLTCSRHAGDYTVTVPADSKTRYNSELDRFKKEAVVQARYSSSPETAGVLEHFTANNTAYMVMVYVDGITLHEFVRRNGPVSFAEAYRILSPLVGFLHMLHQDGLIHRDISPNNIMIERNGKTRILDFGAARKYLDPTAKSYSQAQIEQFSVILHYGYAPIEQYYKHSRQGAETDIYAFGATYYYMVTGRTPVRADQRDQGAVLPAPSALRKEITERQEEVLLKALSLPMEDRYHSMLEMDHALQEALRETQAQKKKEQPRFFRPLLAGLLVLFLIAGGIWIIKQGIGQDEPQEPGADSSTAGTSTTISSGGAGTGEVEITYGPNTVNYSGKAYEIFSAPEQGIEGESQMREFCAKRGGRLAEGTRKDICSFLGRLVLNSGIQDAVIENCQHCQEQLGINRTVFSDDSDYFICEWDVSCEGAAEDKLCPDNAKTNKGHSYLLITYKEAGVTNWEELLAYCSLRGGYPAVINDMEENTYLYQYTLDMHKKNVIFGYTDQKEEGKWVWVHGRSDIKPYWGGTTQPDNHDGKEHYACFHDVSANGMWNDVSFDQYSDSFLCEWDTSAR